MTRPTWHEYFMQRAELTSTRASCPRLSVGAVLTKHHREIASGYNGAPEGVDNCLDAGCMMIDHHCHRAVHAEANAIITAARHGVSTLGSVLYVTHQPCLKCMILVLQAGVLQCFYRHPYRNVDYGDLLPTDHYLVQVG